MNLSNHQHLIQISEHLNELRRVSKHEGLEILGKNSIQLEHLHSQLEIQVQKNPQTIPQEQFDEMREQLLMLGNLNIEKRLI